MTSWKNGIHERMTAIEEKLETIEKLDTQIQSIAKSNKDYISRIAILEEAVNQLKTERFKEFQNTEVLGEIGKLHQIKDKGLKFISNISIAGIPRIVATESLPLKLFGILTILTLFSTGIYNIADLTIDYNNHEVVTKIKRVTPKNITFPAITICAKTSSFKSFHFNHSVLISEKTVADLTMEKFIDSITFMDKSYNKSLLDYFQIPEHERTCFRFNGAMRSPQLITVNSTRDSLNVTLRHEYNETISKDEYLIKNFTFSDNLIRFFVSDNHLDSYKDTVPFYLLSDKSYESKIVKSDIEVKLPEPFNACKQHDNYHQVNCKEECIYREIQKKYNCSFEGLFRSVSLRECSDLKRPTRRIIEAYIQEFSGNCEKECPVGCTSVKFSSENSILKEYGRGDKVTNFQVYVQDFSYLEITQVPKTSGFTFLSYVGGAMGLFMGISFLSFIEVFEFIFEIVKIVLN